MDSKTGKACSMKITCIKIKADEKNFQPERATMPDDVFTFNLQYLMMKLKMF